MLDSEKVKFADAMGYLRDCYPSYRPGVDDFRNTLRAYFEQLQDLSIDVVCIAARKAPRPEFYPEWFPSVGQLRRIAEDARRSNALEEQRARESREREQSFSKAAANYLEHVPVTPQGQEAYIADGTNAFDKLARYWQCESKQLGLRPDQTTPTEIFERRMKQFWKLWAEQS